MRLNLNIQQKGIILVAVPLVFLVTFVVGLSWLQFLAEKEATRLDRSRQILAEAQGLEKAFFDASMTIVVYGVTVASADKAQAAYVSRITGLAQRCDELIRRIPELLADIQKLAAGDQSRQRALADLERSANRGLLMLVETKDAVDRGDKETIMSWKGELHEDYERLAGRLTDEIHRYVQFEESSQRARQVDFRVWAARWLYGGVAAAVLLSLLVIHLFSKEISQRVSVLTANTHRLAKEEALQPLLGGTDEIAHLDQVFHDMASALQTARENEREIERLKQEFVAIVTHDLRTPLTSLQGALELLETGAFGALNDKGAQLLTNSQSSIRRLIRLINDLLDVEKLESGNFDLELADTELGPLIDRSIEAVRHFGARQEIAITSSTKTATVRADGDRIEQVLINLLSNAIKYSPQGSQVAVTSREIDGMVEVRVQDHGTGIPATHRKVIFERFKQVQISDAKQKKGTGLGLAICKSLIEQHGGTIGVESKEGAGSTFWFRLPLA